MKRLLELLSRRGLEINYEKAYEHKDTSAGRVVVEHPKETIYSIQVPITDEEWCDLCMRDGEMYIGGCCTQTANVQDIINEIFRDSGVVNAQVAESLIMVGASHDGFGTLKETSEKELLEVEEEWEHLDPLKKIFLCVAASAPFMKKAAAGRLKDPENLSDVIYSMSQSASYLSWTELFQRSENEAKQHRGNRAVRLARLVPAARSFLDRASKTGDLPFKGFALADASGKMGENMMGYTIFETRQEAEGLLDMWRKSEESRDAAKTVSVRPVVISAEYGLQFMEHEA